MSPRDRAEPTLPAPPSPWRLPAPAYPEHLPGGAMGLSFHPHQTIPMRDVRRFHGAVTNILATAHDPSAPMWSLLYVGASTPSGWALYVRSEEHLRTLSTKTFDVEICGHRTTRRAALTFGPVSRFRAPSPTTGCSRVELVTSTPVSIQKSIPSGGKVTYRRPSTRALHGALDAVGRRLGLTIDPAAIVLRMVRREVATSGIMVGKVHATGVVHGWTGHVVVDCNPVARFLFDVAARIGLGSKVSMGFGRIRLDEHIVQRLDEPEPPPELATARVAEQAMVRYRERISARATNLDIIDALADMAERSDHIDDGRVLPGNPPVELWQDPQTQVVLVVHRFDDGLTITSVAPAGGKVPPEDLLPPVALPPRGEAPQRRVVTVHAQVTWTVSELAVTAYRNRVERVTPDRARATIAWHMAKAEPAGGGWWRGPAPSSLRFLVSGSEVLAVEPRVARG